MTTNPRPILVTGSTGQVGSALLPLLAAMSPVVAPTRAELDLADEASIRAYVRATRPRWILNPAAYTAVDRAESEPHLAQAINGEAPRIFGEEARALGVPVLHVSTDYVFSGEGTTGWREQDRTGPLNVYGRSKLAGEAGLAASGAAHVTLRTSWVYAGAGQNFLRTMLRLGCERPVLRVVDDQYGTPTAAGDLAELMVALVRRFEEASGDVREGAHGADSAAVEEAVRREGGVVHATGGGEPTTWCGFARAIFARARAAEPASEWAAVEAISSAEYPTPARRPLNSRLDCSLLADRFGYRMPGWEGSLGRVMAAMAPGWAASKVNSGVRVSEAS